MIRPRRTAAPKPFVSGGILEQQQSVPNQAAAPVQTVACVAPRNYSYQNTPKRTLQQQSAKQGQQQQTKTPQQTAKVSQQVSRTAQPQKNKTELSQQQQVKEVEQQQQQQVKEVEQQQQVKEVEQQQQVKEVEQQDESQTELNENVPEVQLKQEIQTDQTEEYNQVFAEENSGDAGEEDFPARKRNKPSFKKIFANRKKSSVRAKEKRIRQNRQLRKIILPKNALMALNEVKGITVGDFVINSNVGGGFTAVVSVNDIQYEGSGQSKVQAKNNACERALRDYVLAKMREKPRIRRTSLSTKETAVFTGEEEGVTSVETNVDEAVNQTLNDTDDVPMINLTSFALYKLFSEWESEGYEVPEFHPASASAANTGGSDNGAVVKEPKKPPVRTELPENWSFMHPATLLCVMRPGLSYTDYGSTGTKPQHMIQTFGVVVDGREFIGNGRSKKIARRNAAVAACNALFDTNFETEEPEAFGAPDSVDL